MYRSSRTALALMAVASSMPVTVTIANAGEGGSGYSSLAQREIIRRQEALTEADGKLLGGRDAYGAEITVRSGARSWWRLVNPGFSYLCSNDPRVHFGLGSATAVDGIEVVWPDGTQESFPGGTTDRSLVLRQGSGQPTAARQESR